MYIAPERASAASSESADTGRKRIVVAWYEVVVRNPRWVAVVVLAGCNQILGVADTELVPAGTGGDCAPLPYDSNRYGSLQTSVGFTWSSARTNCQSLGMDLVVIDEDDDEEIANRIAAGPFPYWIGVSHDGDDWRSIDGCPPVLDWQAAEPSIESVGRCGLKTSAGLTSVACALSMAPDNSEPLNAYCETPRPDATCRALAANSTYEVMTDTTFSKNFVEAQQLCAGPGRHVVEINSSAELDQVKRLAPGAAFWLGASRTPPTWSSPTSCPQVFAWAADEPLRGITNDFTCTVYDDGMRVTDCAARLDGPVICETNRM
jgi:hypothetical protein